MKCCHMSGAGNDFCIIDGRGLTMDYGPLAKKLCEKYHTDGFMAVDASEKADFRLHFYNADGSRGEMCGNGSRCICKFAYELGLAGEEMTLETDAGIVYGWRLGENRYRVRLNNPGILEMRRTEEASYVELGTPGVPHAVVELPELTFDMKEELRLWAVALHRDPAFPKGANVNFYTWLGPGHVRVLTFERGVEDYTLACGTGCGSIACTIFYKGLLHGGRLTCENQGGTLEITLAGEDRQIRELYLEGPAETLETFEI